LSHYNKPLPNWGGEPYVDKSTIEFKQSENWVKIAAIETLLIRAIIA